MGDWIGLVFFILLIASAAIGLKVLSKPRISTAEEFERRAAEEKTMLGATMNALQQITDPADARSKEVIAQMKDGTYGKEKREGKANDSDDTGENDD